MKKTLKKISFRFTDKPIDIEELYAKLNGDMECSSQEEKIAIRRFLPILDKKRGLFATKKIDIKKDRYGRLFIDYSPRKSFIERMEESIPHRNEDVFEERYKIEHTPFLCNENTEKNNNESQKQNEIITR